MNEVEWVQYDTRTYYYQHQEYLLKKKVVNSYHVYTIWQNEEMKFNTYNEFEFMRIVRYILQNIPVPWRR